MFSAMPAETIPSVQLNNLEGQQVDLQSFAQNDRNTMFVFWATWCKPAVTELNVLSEKYHEWQDRYNIEIVAVSLDDRRDQPKVRGFVKNNAWEYTILSDPSSKTKQLLKFNDVPLTLITNMSDEIVYASGNYAMGNEKNYEEELARLMK